MIYKTGIANQLKNHGHDSSLYTIYIDFKFDVGNMAVSFDIARSYADLNDYTPNVRVLEPRLWILTS